MTRAIWGGIVIAESDKTIVVEGNHYFPPGSVNKEYLVKSQHTTTCHWKGQADYYDINILGEVNKNAAWTYRDPNPAARAIAGYIAFWKGVRVE